MDQAQSTDIPIYMQAADAPKQTLPKSTRQERRLSLWGELGAGKIITKRSTLGAGFGSWGQTTGFGLEYYIPHVPVSLTAGYIGESLSGAGDAYHISIGNIAVGGRYYLLPYRRGALQPYIGLSALWATSIDYEGTSMVWQSLPITWEVKKDLPRLSLQPSVGVDINVLSLVTFYAAYSARLGLGSGATLQGATLIAQHEVEHTAIRHGLSIGIKINYPFRWRREDSRAAAGIAVGTIVNQIEQSNNNAMINRSRGGKIR